MHVTIVNQPELRIAGIRHIGPYDQIGRTFAKLGGMLNGPPPDGSQMIAVYLDDPSSTPPERLRAEAAMTLSPHAKAPDGLIEQRVPAGDYARATHQGSYEGLPAAWHALKNEWLPSTGRKIGHPSYEVYVNNPMTTEKSQLMTEIYLRLE